MNTYKYLKKCFKLAENGRGKTGVNPLVGAVLVRNKKILAEAYHHGYGQLHAERKLLQIYEQKISTEDIIFVNLEPCCHQGKTPPCTDLIIKKGIKTVVYGMKDPDSRVNGKGIKIMKNNGIKVIGPILPVECRRLNKGFVSVKENKRPYITLKKAQTKEGFEARKNGLRLKITNQKQDIWSHENLRIKHDAILVGINTIIKDNPILNTRKAYNKLDQYIIPWRIVFDPNLKIPLESKVITDRMKSKTIIIIKNDYKGEKINQIKKRGVKILKVKTKKGYFDFRQLFKKLTDPDPEENFYGITSILVEGGEKTRETFKKAGVVDEEIILVGKHEN